MIGGEVFVRLLIHRVRGQSFVLEGQEQWRGRRSEMSICLYRSIGEV